MTKSIYFGKSKMKNIFIKSFPLSSIKYWRIEMKKEKDVWLTITFIIGPFYITYTNFDYKK